MERSKFAATINTDKKKKKKRKEKKKGDEAHFCQLLFSRASNWPVVLTETYPLSTISDFHNFPRESRRVSFQTAGFQVWESVKEEKKDSNELIGIDESVDRFSMIQFIFISLNMRINSLPLFFYDLFTEFELFYRWWRHLKQCPFIFKKSDIRETSFALEENRTCKKTYQRFKIGNFYLEDDDRSALRKFDDSWRNDSTKIWFIFEKNRQKNRESQDEYGIYSTETVGNKILNLEKKEFIRTFNKSIYNK